MPRTRIFGAHDEQTLEQFRDIASRAERAALMADGHIGYEMPIGGVAAYVDRVSVAGVGVDIGCGNAAIRTDATLEGLTGRTLEDLEVDPRGFRRDSTLGELADSIWSEIAFGPGRANEAEDAPVDHELFTDERWEIIPNTGSTAGLRDELRSKARRQLGTVGGGNHYVDVLVDTDSRLWVGVHFGSRGMGYTVAQNFFALTKGKPWGERVKPHEGLVRLDDPIGRDYWNLMELAGAYAYAGREWAARKVVRLMGAEEGELVHNHHNFAWRETHDGREYVVVRKGATPAFPGQKGFVGASMGEDAVILEGARPAAGSEGERLQREALFSTVHGAGRVMGRREAKRKLAADEVEAWLAGRGVIRRGGGLDEAPQAYRRLTDVIDEQGPTIRVLERLRPLIVCMAP